MRKGPSRCLRIGLALGVATLVAAVAASVLAPGERLQGYARVLRQETESVTPLSPWMTDCLMLQARLRHTPQVLSTNRPQDGQGPQELCRRESGHPAERTTAEADQPEPGKSPVFFR